MRGVSEAQKKGAAQCKIVVLPQNRQQVPPKGARANNSTKVCAARSERGRHTAQGEAAAKDARYSKNGAADRSA